MDNGPLCDGAGTDGADAADPDCWTTGLTDSDVDGMSNASDSCAGTARGVNANPAQLNTDATGEWTGDGDATGDACDADPDNDGADNKAESGHGTDPKSRQGASPFDFNGEGKVNILDVLLYKPKLPPAAYDYRYDMNLDGSVNILDVLLFKPVLGYIDPDIEVRLVTIAGPGVAEILPRTDPRQYTVTMAVEPYNPTFTATSVEYNKSTDAVPACKAHVTFACDVESDSPPAPPHDAIGCVWVPLGAPSCAPTMPDFLTSRDLFAWQYALIGNAHRSFSAQSKQVWKAAPDQEKVTGDGLRWTAESDVHFLTPDTEPSHVERSYARDFKLGCTQPGNYTVRIYNKKMLRWPYGDPFLWDNEWVAILHVNCVLP
jgi:hypothetical protein